MGSGAIFAQAPRLFSELAEILSTFETGMAEKKRDSPSPGGDRPRRTPDSRGGSRRLKPEQYDLKVRWEKARQVLDISATGVRFEFDAALKVGTKYPISLSAPGVSFSTTLEVTRCQLTESEKGRHFQVSGKFFPYVE